MLKTKVEELEVKLEATIKTTPTDHQQPAGAENKLTYLTEVNEQMFQQNVRLRQFIEKCIDAKSAPTLQEYYVALREDN